jgi:hypothetical protein
VADHPNKHIREALTEYQFRLIVTGPFTGGVTDEQLLDATDSLGEAGCDDCAISVHERGLELEFDRKRDSLQEAIASAIHAVEGAGFVVESVEMDRDAAVLVGN